MESIYKNRCCLIVGHRYYNGECLHCGKFDNDNDPWYAENYLKKYHLSTTHKYSYEYFVNERIKYLEYCLDLNYSI